jgi:hypothetical protein
MINDETTFRLTIGEDDDGRKLAVITAGGHPQIPNSGLCKIMTLELVELIPNQDTDAWFDKMVNERPWETRQ